MEWEEKYSVGITEIDEEHKTIIRCISRLEAVVEEKSDWLEIHTALDELSYYAKTHFHVEEALLQICQYPGLEAHTTEHRNFAAHVENLKAQSLSREVGSALINFLRGWLADHIMVRDRHYADYLREHFLRKAT